MKITTIIKEIIVINQKNSMVLKLLLFLEVISCRSQKNKMLLHLFLGFGASNSRISGFCQCDGFKILQRSNAERLSWFFCLMSTPLLIRIFICLAVSHNSELPLFISECNIVSPLLLIASIFAPKPVIQQVDSSQLCKQALCKGVFPKLSLTFISNFFLRYVMR